MDSSPSETDVLVADLLKQAEREKRKWKVRQLIAFLLSLNYLASIEIKDHLPHKFVELYQYASLLLFWFVAGGIFGILSRPTRGQKQVAQHLANCKVSGLTGALVETYRILQQGRGAWDLRKTVRDALAARLPLVSEADGVLWTAAQRSALRSLLRTSTSVSVFARDIKALHDRSMKVTDPKLALAALAALEQIGGRDDLNAVALLADAVANDLDARAVRAAAQQCMIALEARVDRRQKSETLLRSCASGDSALLRASSGSVSEAQPRLLLHPSNSDESSTEAHHT